MIEFLFWSPLPSVKSEIPYEGGNVMNWTFLSYHVPDPVNMSGVSVTNVEHFMGCVAIINTPISSV